jgi:hypothetical protein
MRAVSMQPTERWKKNISKAARATEQRLTHFGNRTGRIKAGIIERIEDGVNTARRAAKHGYRAAEDFVDDTTHRIKRDPLRVLGFCFAAGVAAGWILPHRTRG